MDIPRRDVTHDPLDANLQAEAVLARVRAWMHRHRLSPVLSGHAIVCSQGEGTHTDLDGDGIHLSVYAGLAHQ